MLGNLLQKVGGAKQSTEKGKRINDVFDLFSKEKPVIAEPEIVDITAALVCNEARNDECLMN